MTRPTTPGPAVELIERAASIIAAKRRESGTAPYHWAAALYEAGMLAGSVPVATPPVPALVGIGEAAAMLGVSKQRVHQLAPQMPEPLQRLAMGPVWTEASIRQYAAARNTTPGPVATPTQPAEQLGDPYSLGDWIDQTPAAPALLEPVADAIGQAMTTRQGPPEIAARAMAAAAPSIAGMCHWVQNRGTARAETHQAFHYGSPCPYEAMAAVLRGEPDPRDTAEPAGEAMHHPVAALCHSLWCEQPHVTLRRGRHGDCTISTPHWHPPAPRVAERPVPASPDEPAGARPPTGMCWCGGNPAYPHTRGREGCRYAPGGDLAAAAAEDGMG